MSGTETQSFTRYKEETKPIIMKLLEEHSFLPHRSIQIILEQKGYWHTVTWNAIRELETENRLRTAKYPPRGNSPTWVYKYDLRIYDIKDKIDKEYKPLYEEFISASYEMARHCEDIVEKALTEAGFVTLSRSQNTKYFRGRTCPRREDIDFIAYRGGVFYGIEVKNLISYPDWSKDIINKKSVAEYHGIQFVMVCRSIGPYAYNLFRCGGLYIVFDELIWASKFSSLGERLAKKLYFPIICVDSPSEELVSRFRELSSVHDRHFYGKGRI